MHHTHPYSRPYDQRPTSNVSYLRSEQTQPPTAPSPSSSSSSGPFPLLSRAIFDECEYYDSERTSETSGSPTDLSSARSTPVTSAEDGYRCSASQMWRAYPSLPFSYDPHHPNAPRYRCADESCVPVHAPLPSLPIPYLVNLPPVESSQCHQGLTLPPLQAPVVARLTPAPSVDTSSVEQHLDRLPNNRAVCKWEMGQSLENPRQPCGYTARSDMVRRHVKAVHMKIKPLSCDICGVSFASKGTLETHRTKHTGAKPHVCPECGVAFNDPSKRHHHRVKEHGYIPSWRKKRATSSTK